MIFFRIRRFLGLADAHEVQAAEDQQRAVYPGCQRGCMNCLDQACGCNGMRPSTRFITERAARLRWLATEREAQLRRLSIEQGEK